MTINEGVNICCTAVTTHMFTLVGLLLELVTAIEKSKGSIETYYWFVLAPDENLISVFTRYGLT